MSKQTKQAAFATIDALLSRLTTKSAEANTEAGGYAGGTSHPVADVDDGTQKATEGGRSAENTADVKNDQGSPAVDSTAPGTPGGQDSVQMNIGTSQKATGEDSAVETASAKPGKEDGGFAGPSSHPARTDNEDLDGNKYSQARRLAQSVKLARESGHELLAKIAVADQSQARAAKAAGEEMGGGEGSAKLPPETVDESDSSADSPPPGKGESKTAADEAVIHSIALTVKTAEEDADALAAYLHSYYKAAGDEPGPPAGDPAAEEAPAPAEDAGGPPADDSAPAPSLDAPPAPGGDLGGGGGDPMGGGGLGGMDLSSMSAEEFLLQLLGNAGGGIGGGGMSADVGGADALGGMMQPPGGAEPGLPPAGPEAGGMPPAGGGDEAMLQEALAQSGGSPAELQAKAAAAQLSNFKSKTGWKPKTAQEARQFQHTLNMVQEMLAR